VDELQARELRNDVSAVLRRVEGGARYRVTLRGRPVADLVPVSSRPVAIPWARFWAELGPGADEGLRADLAAVLPETTDEIAAA
jgi:prevent-host-death family protein